jgi:hypothetical protein
MVVLKVHLKNYNWKITIYVPSKKYYDELSSEVRNIEKLLVSNHHRGITAWAKDIVPKYYW